MRIRNKKNFWAGIMFIAFGLFFAGFGTQYAIGTAAQMGPGYVPTVLGVIVILLGIAISVGGLFGKATAENVDKFAFPKILLIVGSVVLFAILLKPLGLIISLLVLVAVSSYASHEFSWRVMLVNAIVLTALCVVVFVGVLKLRFQLWPLFIGY
jgi:hypothetical protein